MHINRIANGCVASVTSLIVSASVFVVSFNALPAIAAVPGAPIIGPAWYGKDGATVNFSAPVSDGGKIITGYTVTSSSEGKVVTGTSSPIIVTGLTYGVPNTFTVTATNDDGTSIPSGASGNVAARPFAPTSGTINNLVVMIRFSDQPTFTQPFSYYTGLFNSDPKSLKNFYLENSYNTLTVNSVFPTPSATNLSGDGFSYQDVHPTAYYEPYNMSTNPIGYQTGIMGTQRETVLVTNALNAIKDQISPGLMLDGDGDGYVDHITFEVYSTALNPQPVMFYSRATYDTSGSISLHGIPVGSYTWVAASQDSPATYLASTEIHEMGHSFGYPDLRGNTGRTPVGDWDVMSMSKPVHSGAYMKNKFTKWIADIPEISSTAYGVYTINDITQPTNNSYKIKLPNNEFLVLEYRKASGPFEAHLPGSGLCISRVNEAAGMWGNLGGPPFFIYYFRPGGTFASDGSSTNAFACLNAETGRIQFNDFSNPACFLSDGSPCGISIDAIGTSSGSSITFSIADPATTSVTRVISGYLYNGGNRVKDATVTLSDNPARVVTTDGLGRYLFIVNAGGNYSITPTKANMTFSPTTQTFNNLNSDQIQNFMATKVTTTITGTVTNSSAFPLSGIPVYINCPLGGQYVGSMLTDASGSYSFVVDAGSTCEVYPSLINYFFTPYPKVLFTNVTSNQVQNFTTNPATLTLSGKITFNGTALNGVSVSCPGATTTPVITDAQGKYTVSVLAGNGTVYTVTPSSSLYRFAPLGLSYPGLYASQSNQDYTAILMPTLDVTFIGSGGGLVGEGMQGGYNCTGNPCPSLTYDQGATVKLVELADSDSFFSGWSTNCIENGDDGCVVTMTVPMNVSASFERLQWARNEKKTPPNYGLLINAYNAAGSADIIKAQNHTFDENLQLDNNYNVTFEGGYDADFLNKTGFTTLQGTLNISNGRVTVRNLKIR